MSVLKAIQTARRIKRFERRHNADVNKLLEELSDPTLLDRISQATPEIIITIPRKNYNRAVYSRKRDIIQ